MNYYIDAIEYYLPEIVIDNEFLARKCALDAKFTEEKVGIKERRIAKSNELTSDMAVSAAELLFKNNNINKNDIDLLVVCTQNPDYRLPTTACIVQDKLGLKKDIIAFDVNLGCSGFVYSLPIVGNFVKTGMAKNALLILSDEYSKIIDYKDKNTASIFGDAASAVLLKPCEDGFGVIDVSLGTDGSGAPALIAYNTGIAKDETKRPYVFMDGLEIFKFAVKVIPPNLRELLSRNNLEPTALKYAFFHQANKYIIKEVQKRLKLHDEQVIIDMENVGNTIQSTMPIALKNVMNKYLLSKGDLISFSGYGVGLSWGSVLYKWY